MTVDPSAGPVLLVDDDKSVCRAMARLLRSFGFEVRTYGSAQELLGEGPPDGALCLVADIRMPEMGGVELCEQLHASGHDLPTVLMTGHGAERVRSMVCLDAPILEKPITAERLLQAIEAACHRRVAPILRK